MFSKKTILTVFCAAMLIFGAATARAEEKAAPAPVSPQSAGPALDPRALETLKRMSDTLTRAKSMRFEARSLKPVQSPDGLWVSLCGTSRVVKEGPGKLFTETRGDLFRFDLYFNGKTIAAYSPEKNLYAEKAMAGTVEDLIEEAYRTEGKSFPYSDILVSDPYGVLTQGLVRAVFVGQSTLRPLSGAESVKTDHLAFSNRGVEWQIWIGTEDRLPRMVCATYPGNAGEPSSTVEFGGWTLGQPVSPETFTYRNASQATKVEFRNPMQQGRGVPPAAAVQQ